MNNLELILEELAGKDLFTIYHASENNNLSGIMGNDDFAPGSFGAGYMHGRGFYSVWDKKDIKDYYGKYFYKGVINLADCNILIIDPNFAFNSNKVVKGNYIKEQLKKAGIKRNENLYLPFLKNKNTILYRGKETPSKDFNSSELLGEILFEIPDIAKNFDGVAYKGEIDGHCLLMWNYRKVKIIGQYDVKKNKTSLDIKNFKKQKSEKFSNHTIYSSGNIKIVERNGKYLFFKDASKNKKTPSVEISRELKNYNSSFLLDYKNLKNFLRENKIPLKVSRSLTFTNGKKIISKKSFIKTAENRNSEFISLVTSKDVQKDIENGIFITKVNKILDSEKFSKEGEEYLGIIDDFSESEKFKKIILNYMKKKPIITHCLHTLPVFMEESKYIIFDCQGKKNITLSEEKKRIINYPSKEFNGKFINFPRNIQLSLLDADFLLGEDNNGNFDLTKFFGNTKIFITDIIDRYVNRKLKNLKKSVNMVFFETIPSYFPNAEIIPPCMFLKDIDYTDTISFLNGKKIDFGDSKRNWVFKNFTGEIVFSKKIDINSIKELKRRNPNAKFIKK